MANYVAEHKSLGTVSVPISPDYLERLQARRGKVRVKKSGRRYTVQSARLENMRRIDNG